MEKLDFLAIQTSNRDSEGIIVSMENIEVSRNEPNCNIFKNREAQLTRRPKVVSAIMKSETTSIEFREKTCDKKPNSNNYISR